MVNSLAVAPAPVLPFQPPPPPGIGILVSLGGESAKITLRTDATTAFTHTYPQGNYHFRVFERIQMMVQDGKSVPNAHIPLDCVVYQVPRYAIIVGKVNGSERRHIRWTFEIVL
jgi:hypothetical protein